MILRRPYAFLIKHFKVIHTFLMLCAIFLIYKTYGLVSFFSSYIRHNGVVEIENASSMYVTPSMYIISIFIVVFCSIIIYLLRYKNKPIKIYLIIALLYILLTGGFFWMSSFLYDLQFTVPSIRLISIIRDVFRFSLILQVGVVAICFVRAIGFDLERFDFKKDLLDLGVTKEDNEEYEFEFKLDKDKIRSNIKRKFRYFKYFYKENIIMFKIGALVIFLLIAITVISIFNGMEKIYKEGQYFEINNLGMKVLESYKTNKDALGEKINSKYFYLIVKMEFNNKNSYNYTLGTNLLRLSFGNYEMLSSITSENSKFTEFGVNYYSQELKPHETRKLNYIYEVPIEFYNDSFKLNYLYNTVYEDNELHYNYKKISLTPKTFSDNQKQVEVKEIGEELSFEGSILGDTKITINSVNINDTINYDIFNCKNLKCLTTSKSVTAKTTENFDLSLMSLNYNISYDKNIFDNYYSNFLFFEKFGSIRFEINGKEYNNRIKLVDVTPYNTKGYSIIQVRDKLKIADKIYLDFNIRDKVYTYILKDNTKKDTEENKDL